MSCRLLIVSTLIAVLGASSAGAGANRIPGSTARDVQLTLQARKLLADEPELALLNIGVIVTDRKAVLWGPAPSAEASFRAEVCLRTMADLVEVRNELFVSDLVQAIPPPLKIETPPIFPFIPASPKPASENVAPPGNRKLPGDGRAFGFLMGQEKNDAKKPLAAASQVKPKREPAEIKALRPEALTLPTLGLPEIDGADRELTALVRALLQKNAADRDVQFSVQDRRVYLKATVAGMDAIHEAARDIARIPNVAGVVVVERLPNP